MAGFFQKALPWAGGGIFSKTGKNFLFGQPGKYDKISNLRPSQEPLANQLIGAGLQSGAGGAFGTAADYYRDLMSNDSETMRQLSAPEMRNFNENIIPGLSEQFAGMGAGGLSSSGFRNASVGAGTDLAERLGAIRANLRQQGAAGLQNIGQLGLQQFDENIYEPGTPGFIDQFAPAAANAAMMYFGLPPMAGGGGMGGQGFRPSGMNSFGTNKIGRNTGPYGR